MRVAVVRRYPPLSCRRACALPLARHARTDRHRRSRAARACRRRVRGAGNGVRVGLAVVAVGGVAAAALIVALPRLVGERRMPALPVRPLVVPADDVVAAGARKRGRSYPPAGSSVPSRSSCSSAPSASASRSRSRSSSSAPVRQRRRCRSARPAPRRRSAHRRRPCSPRVSVPLRRSMSPSPSARSESSPVARSPLRRCLAGERVAPAGSDRRRVRPRASAQDTARDRRTRFSMGWRRGELWLDTELWLTEGVGAPALADFPLPSLPSDPPGSPLRAGVERHLRAGATPAGPGRRRSQSRRP